MQTSSTENNTIEEVSKALTVEEAISTYDLYEERMSFTEGNKVYTKYTMLMRVDNEEEVVCYLMPWCVKFDVKSDEEIELTGFNRIVCEVKLELLDDEGYAVTSYWEPGDGVFYVNDIKERFPEEIHYEVLRTVQLYANDLHEEICDEVGYIE